MSYPPDQGPWSNPVLSRRAMRAQHQAGLREAEMRAGMSIEYGPGPVRRTLKTVMPRWAIALGLGLAYVVAAFAVRQGAHIPTALLMGGAATAAVGITVAAVPMIGLAFRGIDKAGSLREMGRRALEPLIEGPGMGDPEVAALARTYTMPEGPNGRPQAYLQRINALRVAAYKAAEGSGDMRTVGACVQAGAQLSRMAPLGPGEVESPYTQDMREFFEYLAERPNLPPQQIMLLIKMQMEPYDTWAREQHALGVERMRAHYAPHRPQPADRGQAVRRPGRQVDMRPSDYERGLAAGNAATQDAGGVNFGNVGDNAGGNPGVVF